MKYKILNQAEDVKESLIEKSGITSEFTLSDLERHEAKLAKNIKELEGTLMVEDAKCKNIESFHPFVLEMSEQDRVTVHTYQQSFAVVFVAKQKIEEIKTALEECIAERKLIIKKLNLDTNAKEHTENKE